MKYVEEFRDGSLARGIAARIALEVQPDRVYRLMEFCGGHTHAISRYGVRALLPDNVQLIHGPGCPVCVLPAGRVDNAIDLVLRHGAVLCTYGDLLRVPASGGASLMRARAEGGDVRIVYSVTDALELAVRHPQRQIVFMAIGFETTTPPTAVALLAAAARRVGNFSVFCNHVLTPPALAGILAPAEHGMPSAGAVDGVIGPAHVSTVIGSRPYEEVAVRYGRPIVIAGFEPLDVLQSVLMLVRQINAGTAVVQNEFTRAVTSAGNLRAQALMQEVFELRPSFDWRGLGVLERSALRLREKYRHHDAEQRYGVVTQSVADARVCECAAVLRGVKRPPDCRVFGTACTPQTPLGACMVSSEGACAAYYSYGP